MDQIDRYQNIETKLTVTLKYKDKNNVFANKLLVFNFFINQKKKKNPVLPLSGFPNGKNMSSYHPPPTFCENK